MTTIALVDDEPNILKALKRALRHEDWQVLTYDSPETALVELRGVQVDLIITDYKMPQMSGVEFLNGFRQISPDAIRLILTGHADIEAMLGAINAAEVFRFILKPWNDDELLVTIKQALEFNRLQRENKELANLVRSQSNTLRAQLDELQRLESISPGITKIDLDENGIIDLSEEYGRE